MKRSKILIIRFSSIGDIVLTSPVIRCLKLQLGAEIHFLTKERFAVVVSGNEYIDHVLSIAETLDEVAEDLRTGNYDYVIDLHHNLRSMQAKGLAGGKAFSFPKLNVEKWVMVNLKINMLPEMHIVDRYFKTVTSLGVTYDGGGLDFVVGEEQLTEVQHLLPREPFVAIAIGAGLKTKCLEPEQISALTDMLNSPVVLLGGPEDSENGEAIAAQMDDVINLAGIVSLKASAAALKSCSLLITPDTGLMHMAAALKKPIISVWGNTIPAFGMTPLYPNDHVVQHRVFEIGSLPCRPCSKIGYDHCPKGHFRCIRELPISEIAATANAWLEQ